MALRLSVGGGNEPGLDVPHHIGAARRLFDKIQTGVNEIVRNEETALEDAEIAVVSYDITSRTMMRGIELARKKGARAACTASSSPDCSLRNSQQLRRSHPRNCSWAGLIRCVFPLDVLVCDR